jgi:hypothetical protein
VLANCHGRVRHRIVKWARVRTIIDLLFWWVVEPSDDAAHASVWIGVVLGLVFLGVTALFWSG